MGSSNGCRDGISDDAILTMLAVSDWPLGTTEVADRFDVSQQAAYARLKRLAEQGLVEKKTTGGTTLWRPA